MEHSNMDIQKEEPAIESATQRVCRACLESNLTSEIIIARCSRCTLLFCTHFTSNIDPQYCTECLSNMSLHKEIITKTYDVINDEGEVIKQVKRTARLRRLEGMDWLFSQRKIYSMSDESLELAIEYHREILTGMLNEREQRKAKFLHRFANVKYEIPPKDATASVTTVKKVKTVSSTRDAAMANAMIKAFLAQGLSMEKIMEMIEKAGKK